MHNFPVAAAFPFIVTSLRKLELFNNETGANALFMASIGSKLSLQRGAKFREGMGNGLRLRITQNDGHKPKTRKGNQIMKNRNIQFKPTAGVLIPLLLACFAAVFISAPTPAAARDMVPFNGTVSGYVDSQSGTECEPSTTRDQLRTREPIGSLHRDSGILAAPLRTRPGSL